MDKRKVILVLMMIVIVVMIIIIAILLLLRTKQINMINNQKEELIANLREKVTKIENKDQFFAINNHIKKYFDYKKQNNLEAIKAISGNTTINYNNFQSKEMYLLNKITNYTVYVYGEEREQNTSSDAYIIVNLDYRNYTFSIEDSSKQEFENAKNNLVQKKYQEDIEIQSNAYNEIILAEKANDFQVLKEYFDDYKFKAINDPKEAFALIDANYKEEKFNNSLEEYKTYIQKNINTIQDANIVKHGVTKEGSYTKYTFTDNYNHYYELKETGIYEYTIILDNYTVEDDTQKEQYAQLTDEQKARTNMDKVMKLINEKDYGTIYGYLNTEFKNTNFPTLEAFTNYMQEAFFENNIVGTVGIRQEGNVYLLKVPYKESLSTAAEEDEKTFMMRLGEGTNFELSFEV